MRERLLLPRCPYCSSYLIYKVRCGPVWQFGCDSCNYQTLDIRDFHFECHPKAPKDVRLRKPIVVKPAQPPKPELGPRQQQIVNFVRAYEKQIGNGPPYEYVANALDMSTMRLAHHLDKLKKKGWIVRKKGRAYVAR